MKTKLLALGLVSGLFTLSAAAFTCPPTVMCIDKGNGRPTCVSDLPGSPFIMTGLSMVNLPEKNQAYVFNFQEAILNKMMPTRPQAYCLYDISAVDNSLNHSVSLYSNFNLTADKHVAGNNWTNAWDGISQTCSGNVFQCPFVKVATK